MHRRTLIRNIVLVSTGASILPSCLQEDQPVFPLKNMRVSADGQKMLELLTETIVPRTAGFPGANDLKTHQFVLTMMDDCANPENQSSFLNGMKLFDEACRKKWNKDFVKASGEERIAFLKELEVENENNGDAQKFYRSVKRYSIQSLTSSKQFLTEIRKFTLVPGSNFKGCVKIASKA